MSIGDQPRLGVRDRGLVGLNNDVEQPFRQWLTNHTEQVPVKHATVLYTGQQTLHCKFQIVNLNVRRSASCCYGDEL